MINSDLFSNELKTSTELPDFPDVDNMKAILQNENNFTSKN